MLSRGTRAAAPTMVVALGRLEDEPGGPPRVGFIVGRAVGGSVVRHRVVRRLRHLAAGMVDQVPVGWGLVIRALPPAAQATSAQLGGDLEVCMRRLRGRMGRDPRTAGMALR